MSGFDFDALRDPEAPIPGSRERDGVRERASEMRGRQLRNRIVVSTTVMVVAAAAVVGVVAAQRQSGPEISVPGVTTTAPSPTPTSSPAVADRFIPPTTIENGKVVLPVTQPDGATFAVRYPPNMHIAELGFAGLIDINALVGNGGRCCTAAFSYTTVAHVYGNTPPVATYRGAHGKSVPLYAHRPYTSQIPPSIAPPSDLAFQFGPWLVEVYLLADQGQGPVQLTEQQVATLARSLTGSVDSRGYLLLQVGAPFSIGDKFYGGFGSETGGMSYTASNNLAFDSHLVCGHPPTAVSMDPIATPFLTGPLSRGNVQWCVNKVLHVQATGSAKFLTAALHDLEVSPLRSPSAAPTTTTTTTTAPRVTSSDSAESSSFVSPQHGWVLDQSGNIDETTDGGATWTRIARVAAPTYRGGRIRFADALHGYVFEPGGDTMMTTDDGGSHWSRADGPFSSISDLAISRGVVYLVGLPSATSPVTVFRIWSIPVGGTHWSMDPLVIRPGAGPIPEQTLTFSGDGGWMINNDRDLISGARLSPTTGRWSKWTPPCTGGGGLAASTSRDLVLACGPPFATSASATTIAFSHDGGDTFGPPSVPGSGFVQSGPFSPSANIAFVVASGGLWRTTDGGASWHLVLPADVSQGFADYGFTTSTQGFVIFGGSGEMLMTYDAGATWQKVMGP